MDKNPKKTSFFSDWPLGRWGTRLWILALLVGLVGIWELKKSLEPEKPALVVTDIFEVQLENTTDSEIVSHTPGQPNDHTPNITKALSGIQNFQADLNTLERVKLLSQFYDNLSASDVSNLFVFFATPAPLGNPVWTPDSVYELKNNLLNVLLRNGDPGDWELKLNLIALSENKHADLVMQDYALQHLADLLLAGNPQTDDFDHHLNMLDSQYPELAATAMLHLLAADRQQVLNPVKSERLSQKAAEIAANPRISPASRATALQVASRLQNPEVEALAFKLAENDNEALFLRIAAIASLGDLAASRSNETVIQFLNDTAKGREIRLHAPANSALKRIQNELIPMTL